MQLKNYQEQALEKSDFWFKVLKKARKDVEDAEEFYAKKGRLVPEELKNFPCSAWNALKGQNISPDYISRTAASGDPIPHVCLKVPTGGGKTLLGVAALECLGKDTGFVLWIVPTKAIYEQTRKAFQSREHPYRQMLERISRGKVKFLQKSDRFTKQDIENQLCVMMLMLPSANRKKGRDFLKIFRDSSGYTSFFPVQDDSVANHNLIAEFSDLMTNEDGDWVKHSLINVLKLIRPTVILDEAHKAYGKNTKENKEFVKSVNQLNPRVVLELSATPNTDISNILVNVSGLELQAEEMIKLPIEIHCFVDADWKYTLSKTQKKLHDLEKEAGELQARENRYIRPIALVRVQRTGEGQQQSGLTHSDDVRDYLIKNLSVPENQIRIQSSEQKELADEDLLSETCNVRWIITKDALKEGWDCSFAYVLALLDNTKATITMTQMVGRVMRQPHARVIEQHDALNRCYIYCYNRDVGDVVEDVKTSLEKEGLTGLGNQVHGKNNDSPQRPITIKRRRRYKNLQIFLPRVLHKERKVWRPMDYDRDILSALNWDAINANTVVNLDDSDVGQEIVATMGIQSEEIISKKSIDTGEQLSLDYFVRRLMDMVPNPWQAARMAESFINKYKDRKCDNSKLFNNRIHLSEVMRREVYKKIDSQAEAIFRKKIKDNEIRFHLITDKALNYELRNSFEVYISSEARSLQGEHGTSIQRSLFDPIFEGDFNTLEKKFALYLEKSKAIHWWHKIAARQEYSLQGWRRRKVYPDFIVHRQENGALLVLETKGIHLEGNEDTTYKGQLLEMLETTYETALERGELEIVGETPAKYRMLIEDTWREKLDDILY